MNLSKCYVMRHDESFEKSPKTCEIDDANIDDEQNYCVDDTE